MIFFGARFPSPPQNWKTGLSTLLQSIEVSPSGLPSMPGYTGHLSPPTPACHQDVVDYRQGVFCPPCGWNHQTMSKVEVLVWCDMWNLFKYTTLECKGSGLIFFGNRLLSIWSLFSKDAILQISPGAGKSGMLLQSVSVFVGRTSMLVLVELPPVMIKPDF